MDASTSSGVGPSRAEESRSSALVKRPSDPEREPMSRKGFGSRGQKIPLVANHFKVDVTRSDEHFYHYSVAFFYDDKRRITDVTAIKEIGRRVIEELQRTYSNDFHGKDFAYDGLNNLFTFGSLPRNKFQHYIMLDNRTSIRSGNITSIDDDESLKDGDRKRMKRQLKSKTIYVEISYAAKISLRALADILHDQRMKSFQDGVRVLDVILRQNAAKKGCLLVNQSFFYNNPNNFVKIGGGVLGCRGFHSSFRATQVGLSLNLDTSTTITVRPGPVMDFLLQNQDVKDFHRINWSKAKKVLKNLRIKTLHTNVEYKITGLSDNPCNRQMFLMKERNRARGDGDARRIELSVYDYFLNNLHIPLHRSRDLPCINVGKRNRPTYFPLELCELVSLQRYTKALSILQRASLVEKSRQGPQERMKLLEDTLRITDYNADPMLEKSGFNINSRFTKVEGRVLSATQLLVGKGIDFTPRNGRWNFNNKNFVEPIHIEKWAAVNFSARQCDTRQLCESLIKCGKTKGVRMSPPLGIFEEGGQDNRATPVVRVEKMFQSIRRRLENNKPNFLLCILSEKKNSDIYGPWKRLCLSNLGIVTQCLAPKKVTDQYLTNLLLKINVKLGGINSYLCSERFVSIPQVSKIPTLIVGMDVSHSSPGQNNLPSVAAVVNSRQWPCISRYRATVRTQPPQVQLIADLFKPTGDADEGIFRQVLEDFYLSSNSRKPEQIIIFRDGVSESQFREVLNNEFGQILEACRHRNGNDTDWHPKFMIVVAQKNHHTKFFQPGAIDNVPAGTVIDNRVCDPKHNDFYMCAHAGMIGTTRPTHYHVLLDEIGFTADDLQELVHSLSYVYQRSTTAVSVVAPIRYAHHAATQLAQFIKFEELRGADEVPIIPKLKDQVCNTMFFC